MTRTWMPQSCTALLIGAGSALALMVGGSRTATADAIPYPNGGSENPVTYTFTAATTGEVIAFFAGTGAGFTEQLGLLDNGVQTSAGFGLVNHASAIGDSFDLGHVTAGDTLVFDIQITDGTGTVPDGSLVFSVPAMNNAYDGGTGLNHIYSTAYTNTGSPDLCAGGCTNPIPAGAYVGFEDLPASFPPDFNYTDETFVFTNVNTVESIAEPAPLALLATALAGIGLIRRRPYRA